jgi:beta-glucanase (GH16 family)
VGVIRRFGVALTCATIALGLLSVAVAPALAGAGEPGHAQAAKKKKKKCKKRAKGAKKKRKKCKRPKHKGPKTPSSPIPAPGGGSGPAPPPAPGECGAPIAKSGGGYWDCTFADNFDGTSLNSSKWVPQRTATSGYVNGPTACFVDSPNNISVSDGSLRLTARSEGSPFGCAPGFTTQYTSGMVTTAAGRFSQAYGRFEIRAKVSSAEEKGLQSSFWLWPVDAARYGAYPASGEIDIAELFSQYPDRAIPYVHYKPLALVDPLSTNTLCFVSNPGGFHTYTLEWTQTNIKISYDGNACLLNFWIPALPLQRPQPFDQPFFIALTQALGVGTNEFDPETTPLPATTEVDYVRVWK